MNYTVSVLFSNKYSILTASREVEHKFKKLMKKVYIDEKGCLSSIYIQFQAFQHFFSSTITMKDMQNLVGKRLIVQLLAKLVDDLKVDTAIHIEIPVD